MSRTGHGLERLGRIAQWHDDRGFGFVAPVDDADASERVFFHIRDYDPGVRRPEIGELVKFSVSRQGDGRWRARRVRRAVAPHRGRNAAADARRPTARALRGPTPAWALSALVVAYAGAIALAVHNHRLPVALVGWFAVINVLTMILYHHDKVAAQRGSRRVPESTLHALEISGGWPCALLAQRLFRHKTAKASYRAAFWIMVALHLALLAWLVHGRVLIHASAISAP